jgi:hypothetical protein
VSKNVAHLFAILNRADYFFFFLAADLVLLVLAALLAVLLLADFFMCRNIACKTLRIQPQSLYRDQRAELAGPMG